MTEVGRKNIYKEKIKRFFPELCSFIIPVFVVMLAFFGLGIYPGGKSMLITYDLRAQLLALYGYLSNGGPGYDTLFHSMSGGLGGGFFGTVALYLSPFDLIYLFVPVKYIPHAIYFLVIFKIGLCGLFFSIFLRKNGKMMLPFLWVVILSCCYALMSYNFMYYVSPMWYDEVMYLPIMALGLEKVLSGKRSYLFIIILWLSIVSDYYIAFMSVITLIIYFCFRLIEEKLSLKKSAIRILSFCLHGLLSAGMALFVIVPVCMDFARGKFAEGSAGYGGDFIKNSLFDILKSLLSQSYSGFDYNASPNIFCGSIITILVIVWLFFGKDRIITRLSGIFVLLFYFASFIFGPLDRMWHGFREPVCFSVRYAYTFCFFSICFAARGIMALKVLRGRISKQNFRFITAIIGVFTFVELYINGAYILSKIGTEYGYTYKDEYYKFCDVNEYLISYTKESDSYNYGRLITSYKFSDYDGALFGYDGIAEFSSSYNYSLHDFFKSLGIGVLYHSLSEKGVTPPSSGLINSKYLIYYWVDQTDLYTPICEYRGYTLYKNDTALPFSYEITNSEETEEFSDDPFSNINLLYGELFRSDETLRCEIFKACEYEIISCDDVFPANDESKLRSIVFDAEKTGHYYLYVEFIAGQESFGHEETYRDKMPVYRNYYIDGVKIGEYGNESYNYCVDLGKINAEEKHTLSLESSNSEIGRVWLYYYDSDEYNKVYSTVNGFKINSIDNKGIVLYGHTSDASQILVTLPYEAGYRVYVDGVKTEYNSYRDCFMTIPVPEGEHEIRIKYITPGIYTGIALSILFLFTLLLYTRFRNEKNIFGEY